MRDLVCKNNRRMQIQHQKMRWMLMLPIILFLLELPELQAEECTSTQYADIVFIIDTSGSVKYLLNTTGDYWYFNPINLEKEIQFMDDLVDKLDIGTNKTQVGVMNFDLYTNKWFDLNTYKTNDDLKKAIDDNRKKLLADESNWGTYINRALKEVNKMFLVENGMRKDALHIAIVITDGNSHDKVNNSELMSKNISIYAIGVGDLDRGGLENITTLIENVFIVDDFDTLQSISAAVIIKTCARLVCTNENCIHGDCGTMFRCSCNMGYTGEICETALCSETLCDECNVDMIRCDTCNEAFTGTNCETELCNPSRCLNGECSSDFYTCECDKGYTGPQCKEKPLTVRIEGYDKPLKVGDQLALQCIPNDEEREFKFYWAFTPVGGEVDYISFDQNLIIEDVTKDNAGNYVCSIFEATDTIDVVVKSKDVESPINITPAPLISIKHAPIIGLSSCVFLMFISAVSVILWKRRERQRIAEENSLPGVSFNDYPTFSDSNKIEFTSMN